MQEAPPEDAFSPEVHELVAALPDWRQADGARLIGEARAELEEAHKNAAAELEACEARQASPSMPGLRGMPGIPGIADLTGKPSMPGVPGMLSLPSMPGRL